jgi:hypothetical protein
LQIGLPHADDGDIGVKAKFAFEDYSQRVVAVDFIIPFVMFDHEEFLKPVM